LWCKIHTPFINLSIVNQVVDKLMPLLQSLQKRPTKDSVGICAWNVKKKRCLKAKSVEVRKELSFNCNGKTKYCIWLDLKSKVSSLDFEIKFGELQLTKLELFLQSTNKDNQGP